MFYHTYILTKRGPFAKIWLAAHWDKKLSKNDLKVIDLSKVVLNLIEPAVPISLRTSGELMLGVVRVYGHKVRILLKDTQDAVNDLSRGRELNIAATNLAKRKGAISSDAISAVTHTEPLEKGLNLMNKNDFEKDFAAIEDLVMNVPQKGTSPQMRASANNTIEDRWFRIHSNDAEPSANIKQDFTDEITRDFFDLREASVSDGSKKGSSSGSSLEELRKATNIAQSAEKSRLQDEIGLPIDEPMLLPDLPDLAGQSPWRTEMTFAGDKLDAPGMDFIEPPRKKRLITMESLIDKDDVVIPSDVYRKHMHDRSELLNAFYPQGPSVVKNSFPLGVDNMRPIGEQNPWEKFDKIFETELRSKMIAKSQVRPFGEETGMQISNDLQAEFPDQMMQYDTNMTYEDVVHPIPEESVFIGDNQLTLIEAIKESANTKGVAIFEKVFLNSKRSKVARGFSELLSLISQGEAAVRQDRPFGDIFITTH